MGIQDLRTKVTNKTDLHIDFDVEDKGTCPLRGLPPGGSQSVSLSLLLKCCRERGSASWPIRVLINKRFYGMRLHPHDHILKMTRVVFRYERRADGSCIPILEGVVENFFNRFFGCCINSSWKRKTYVEIAKADSTWPMNNRSSGDPNIVGRNNIKQGAPPASASSGRRRVVVIRAFPAKQRRNKRRGSGGVGRTTPEPDLKSGENSTYNIGFLLFGVALTLVACVRLFW